MMEGTTVSFCNAIEMKIPVSKRLSRNQTEKKLNAPFNIIISEGVSLKDKCKIVVGILNHEFPKQDNGVAFWKLVDSSFYNAKKSITIRSGLYRKNGEPLYFIKYKSLTEKPYFRLLFFSNLKGKILYGIYESQNPDLEKWDTASTNILKSVTLL